nr:hypothetical protein [Pandoravirus massiliensis]
MGTVKGDRDCSRWRLGQPAALFFFFFFKPVIGFGVVGRGHDGGSCIGRRQHILPDQSAPSKDKGNASKRRQKRHKRPNFFFFERTKRARMASASATARSHTRDGAPGRRASRDKKTPSTTSPAYKSTAAASATVDVEMRARIRAYRRRSSVNPADGGLYDWPVPLINAQMIKGIRESIQDDAIVVEAPPPLSLAAVLPVPTRWPFWADTDERRARWTAMVTAQRMARNTIPQCSLDECKRCRMSIIDRCLDVYGPPERYATGDAEWQKTARACDAARRMLDRLDDDRRVPSLDVSVYEKMARDTQRLLMIIAERTEGLCSPGCRVLSYP